MNMKLNDVFIDKYFEASSSESINNARNALALSKPGLPVIITDEKRKLFYLLDAHDFLEKIKGIDSSLPLGNFLPRLGLTIIPAIDTSTPMSEVPNEAVAITNGQVAGYFSVARRYSQNNTRSFEITGEVNNSSITSGPDVIDRHPYFINTHCSNQAVVKEIFTVRITLSNKPAGSGTIPALVETGTEIDIILEPKKGFELRGSEYGKLIAGDLNANPSILYKLLPLQTGPGKIRVLAFSKGIEIGHTNIDITITTTATDPEDIISTQSFKDDHLYPLPDLTLQISELDRDGKIALLYRLTTAEGIDAQRLYLTPFGPVTLRLNPAQYFQDIYDKIQKLRSLKDANTNVSRLGNIGMQIFNELFPQDLRELIWLLKDKIKSLKIDSDEPWIPWELCKLTGTTNGRVEEDGFFCEKFEVTRWIQGHGAPKSKISLQKMAIVVPENPDLTYTIAEKKNIAGLLEAKGKIVVDVPATYQDVQHALSQGYTAWHFSGHGSFTDLNNPDSSKIVLEYPDELSPSDLSGENENMGKNHPLVFLNACQAGKSALGLTGMSGWAPKFLKIGAGVFIGAHWNISDEAAYKFSVKLYDELLQNTPIAKAVHRARLHIKTDGDATWLAYSVYADPFAEVST